MDHIANELFNQIMDLRSKLWETQSETTEALVLSRFAFVLTIIDMFLLLVIAHK